jgi:carbamoyl-phosphate synthase large subunit
MGVLPPQRFPSGIVDEVEKLSRELAVNLKIVGHLNLQLAIKGDQVYVLEANPRSSRSVPFVSKATGIPLVKLAMGCMLGEQLHVTRYWRETEIISVKGVVFPFKKFSGVDILLGPEMRSTGESMGRSTPTAQRGASYAEALEKAFIGAGVVIPRSGKVFFSIKDKDKKYFIPLATKIIQCGFQILGTAGTAAFFKEHDIKVEVVNKVRQGSPHCVDMISSGLVQIVFNTTSGGGSISDSFSIRRSCVEQNVPCLTELSAAEAFVKVLQLRASTTTNENLQVSPIPAALDQ